MAKTATRYVCQSCASVYSRWAGKCENCGTWNSLVEEAAPSAAPAGFGGRRSVTASALKPTKLGAVQSQTHSRIGSGFEEVDRVLGGGIVPGSVMLLSGDPGIGKSTLVLQVASMVGSKGSVLYVSGEESASQIKLRADRLGIAAENLDLLTETSADAIAATVEAGGYSLIIIDSIQTMATEALTGAPGSAGQITASAQTLTGSAKRSGSAMLIIGHVTKEGSIAGPKILEHLVDVVLYLEGDKYGSFKALRGIKNRFGSTAEVGIFEMAEAGLRPVANPSEALLAERQNAAGSAVLATLEGTRPLLVEVQALVAPTPFGYPRRTAVGFDLNRLNLLVAVLAKRAGIDLGNQDVYVNIVGGLRVTEPAADLAIILSIVSAYRSQSLPPDLAAFGEVGLSGEVRSVSQSALRAGEAARLGLTRAVGPAHGAASDVVGVRTIAQALEVVLPKTS